MIPAGNTTYTRYNFVVAKPLVTYYRNRLAAVETELEQTFLENSELILDLNELRHTLKTSFQVKIILSKIKQSNANKVSKLLKVLNILRNR